MKAGDAEGGVLDLLVLVAENLKVLILVPILAGGLAWGLSSLLPRTYVSQAMLDPAASVPATPAAQAAAMLTSPLILDQVIESLELAGSDAPHNEAERSKLSTRIKAAVGKDGLLRLDVTASAPAQAQSLANALIDAWLKSTVPGERKRAELESRLAHAQQSLEAARLLRDRLAREGIGSSPARQEVAALLGMSDDLQMRHLDSVITLSGALKGVSRDVVKQPPTLPSEPVAPRRGLVALVTALVAGFAVMGGLFIRQAWRSAGRHPATAEKQARLLAVLGFGARFRSE